MPVFSLLKRLSCDFASSSILIAVDILGSCDYNVGNPSTGPRTQTRLPLVALKRVASVAAKRFGDRRERSLRIHLKRSLGQVVAGPEFLPTADASHPVAGNDLDDCFVRPVCVPDSTNRR